MRKVLLSFLCLMMALGLYGEVKDRELSKNKENYLAKKSNAWYDFYSDISIYSSSQVLERMCCQLLGINEQQSLQTFVDKLLESYDSKIPFTKEQFEQLKSEGPVGIDYVIVRPKGQSVGNCQTFEIIRIIQNKGMKNKMLRQWTILYDKKNDRVLTVDDVFVPETARLLKTSANGNFISLYVQKTMVSYGSTIVDDKIHYDPLDYIQNANEFSEQFKQAIAFEEFLTDNKNKGEVRPQKQTELQKLKDSYAKTAHRRITNDFGKFVVSESLQTNLLSSWAKSESPIDTEVKAGKFVLKTFKNTDGTVDSLWVRLLMPQQSMKQLAENQKPGVSDKMVYGKRKTETTTRTMVSYQRSRSGHVISEHSGPSYSYESGNWITHFDIDIPNNPILEQYLCKLLFNKSGKQLKKTGEKFVKSFSGKTIRKERANGVIIRGHVLSYNSGKYYSYAYSHTYSAGYDFNSSQQIGEPIAKNIIYDIKNQKLLSLPDVLTAEEIAYLNLNKKSKADLALDDYNLYVGVDGKRVRTYALCHENWNKFTGMLQDLIGPYDNLPAKIDSSFFNCKDYEGVQPTSISYKINQEPLYEGHSDSLLVYLKSHLVLPKDMKDDNSWRILFVVGKDGHVSQVETTTDKKSDDGESFASMLTETFKQMPAWKPMTLAGFGAQNSLLAYNVKFVPLTNPNYYICETPDVPAKFPNGDGACFIWLNEHIKYPSICQEQGIQGCIIVNFVIEKDGSVTEVKAINPIDPNLAKEAERVVKMMPKWIPAMYDGEPVRSRFVLPIMFRLN